MAEHHADRVEQMYWLVAEGGHLHEAPLGAVDDPGPNQIVHGPFNPAECSRVLSEWAGHGWLELRENGNVLAGREAQDLVRDVGRWRTDRPVQVQLSEIGVRVSRSEFQKQAEMGFDIATLDQQSRRR